VSLSFLKINIELQPYKGTNNFFFFFLIKNGRNWRSTIATLFGCDLMVESRRRSLMLG
jgi:hypothetical protein